MGWLLRARGGRAFTPRWMVIKADRCDGCSPSTSVCLHCTAACMRRPALGPARKRRETPLRRWAAASEKPRLLPASFWQAEEEEKGPGLNGDIGQTLRSCWSVRRDQRGTHVHIHGFCVQDYGKSKILTVLGHTQYLAAITCLHS